MLGTIGDSVLVLVIALTQNKEGIPPELSGALIDDDNRIKKLVAAHNALFTDVSDLKASGLPKGFYDNINLDSNVDDLKDEQLDSEIHSLDEIQEQNARAMIILNRNYKALEARRVAAHKVRVERDQTNLPAPKDKPPQSKEPEAPNPFPFLQSKA